MVGISLLCALIMDFNIHDNMHIIYFCSINNIKFNHHFPPHFKYHTGIWKWYILGSGYETDDV